jgi:hypothetical protein
MEEREQARTGQEPEEMEEAEQIECRARRFISGSGATQEKTREFVMESSTEEMRQMSQLSQLSLKEKVPPQEQENPGMSRTGGEFPEKDRSTDYDGNKADLLKERLRAIADRARGSGPASLEKTGYGDVNTGKRSSTSEAIAALRRGSLTAPNLSGNDSVSVGELGSLRVAGDHRHNLISEVSDFKNKLNISRSFNSESLLCCCKNGRGGGWMKGWFSSLAIKTFPL